MVTFSWRSIAFFLLVALLPTSCALAGGKGGGGLGGGVGAAGVGSAAVGGGAPAGQVGGGPPAGAVGGGTPGAGYPAGNGSAGTGNPSLNALGAGSAGTRTNEPGIPNATTKSGGLGAGDEVGIGATAPARSFSGGAAPTAPGNESSSSVSKREDQPPVAGDVLDAPFSPTGLSRPGRDGTSTVIVDARPCGVSAHETDGFTTCVGIPRKRPANKR